VGHDWGGIISWSVVQDNPELFEKYIVMNGPHEKVFEKILRESLSQVLKSWYMFMFQCPYLPEWIFSVNDYDAFNDVFTSKSTVCLNLNLLHVYSVEWHFIWISLGQMTQSVLNGPQYIRRTDPCFRGHHNYYCTVVHVHKKGVLILMGVNDSIVYL
jgi:pimeloyl-ACP methyl ester carboxylesterase